MASSSMSSSVNIASTSAVSSPNIRDFNDESDQDYSDDSEAGLEDVSDISLGSEFDDIEEESDSEFQRAVIDAIGFLPMPKPGSKRRRVSAAPAVPSHFPDIGNLPPNSPSHQEYDSIYDAVTSEDDYQGNFQDAVEDDEIPSVDENLRSENDNHHISDESQHGSDDLDTDNARRVSERGRGRGLGRGRFQPNLDGSPDSSDDDANMDNAGFGRGRGRTRGRGRIQPDNHQISDGSHDSSGDESNTDNAGRGHRGRGRGRGRARGRGRIQHDDHQISDGSPDSSGDDSNTDNAGRGHRGRGRARGRGRGAGQHRRQNQAPQLRWRQVQRHAPTIHPFTVATGLSPEANDSLPDDKTPSDFFSLYITDDIIDNMVVETNRYAEQLIAEKTANGTLKGKSRLHKWSPTSRNEMKSYIGVLILTGLLKKGSWAEYWSTTDLLYTPAFKHIMPRDRFMLLKRCWHLNDNQAPGYDPQAVDRDRLHKLRPFVDALNARCREVYIPTMWISVDESLILFRGRLLFRQTIRTKRARVGVKMYPVCTSDGITLGFRIYTADGIPFEDDAAGIAFTATEQIVLCLVEPYLDKGYHVYTDNFYTSPQLAKYLLTRNTHLCGTIRQNRKNYPTQQVNAHDLDRGDIVNYVTEDNGLLAVKYREARDRASGQPKVVHMLSTMHNCSTHNTGRLTRRNLQIIKPKCVADYNKHMGGVDVTDQQLGLQSICPMRKTLKWYCKVAIRLILQMLLNAHKVYRKTVPVTSKHTLRWFALQVARDWIHEEEAPIVIDCNAVGDEESVRLNGKLHIPSYSTPKECRVCRARGHRSSIRLVCETCPRHPVKHTTAGLCIKPCTKCPGSDQPGKNCWAVWHTQKKLTA